MREAAPSKNRGIGNPNMITAGRLMFLFLMLWPNTAKVSAKSIDLGGKSLTEFPICPGQLLGTNDGDVFE